ncbi:MAG: TonB-dependent receptor plug domain-containing protein, partial [Steroidobacteraceae bacterium]
MKNNIPLLTVFAGLSGMAAWSGSANGQGIVLEEVLVTAQKRSENIMEVPISITALTADSLEKSNIGGMDDVQTAVSGIEFRRQVAAMAPFIRGIGSQNATVIGFEPSVALYIDGVYQSLPLNNGIGFKNIERVEVLKGPQGTLFGRNATGGAVNVITKNPQHDPSASIKLGYGNFDTSNAEFYGTTGITKTLAADLSIGYTDQKEGYGDNIILDEDVNKQRAVTVRNKWIWEPSEQTTATLSFSYDKTTESPGSARAIAKGTMNQFGVPALDDFYDTQENFIEGIDTGNSHFDGHAAATESKAATLRVDQSFDAFSLVSITGYIDQEAFITVDNDSSNVSAVHAQLPYFNEQFSQEFQFISNNEGPFNWIGGLYYMKAKQKYDIFAVRAIPGFPVDRVEIDNSLDISSAAAFAEVGYDFTEQTELTLGLRWTKEEKELKGITNACVT